MILFDSKEVLFELMEKFESVNIDEFTLKSGDFEISMKKNTGAANNYIPETAAVIKNENIMVKPIVNSEEKPSALAENDRIIKAPFIGTYYAAPSPGAAEFVYVGKKVAKGDVLCIISAMKTMNDIESEYDGEITEIFNSNDSMVECGADLFKIRIK